MVDNGNQCPKCKVGKMIKNGDTVHRKLKDKNEAQSTTPMVCDKCGYEENEIVVRKNIFSKHHEK